MNKLQLQKFFISILIVLFTISMLSHLPAQTLNENNPTISEFDQLNQDPVFKIPIQVKLPESLKKNAIIHTVATSPGELVTVMSEGFEGSFPSGLWSVNTGNYTWGTRNYLANSGSNSCWAIGGGTIGSTLSFGANYPNSIITTLVYGPIDLSDANWSAFSFALWLYSQQSTDYLQYLVSNDGTYFYGYQVSGSTGGNWFAYSLPLTAVPTSSSTFVDFTGSPAVYIAFRFITDASTNYANGAFVDDVVWQKGMLEKPSVITSFSSPGSSPRGLAFDGANLWNADAANYRIYKLSTSGTVLSSFSSPSTVPNGIAWDGTNLWNADANSDRIYKLTTSGTTVTSFTAPGGGGSGLAYDGSYLWYCDYSVPTIWKLNTSGSTLTTFSAPGTRHYGLAYDGTNLYLADAKVLLIYKMDTAGNILGYYPIATPNPSGLAWDGKYFWLADQGADKIYKLEIKQQQQIVNDIGATSMILPPDLTLGDSTDIAVVINNFGTADQSNFPVNYRINDGVAITENFVSTLSAGISATFTFSNAWKPSATGTYNFIAWTSLAEDEDVSNDALQVHEKVVVHALNSSPVLANIGNQTVTAGQTKHVSISATDIDVDQLSFEISTNPGFLSLTNFSQTGNTATATLVIAPSPSIQGSFNTKVEVSDGRGGIDDENFTIVITSGVGGLADSPWPMFQHDAQHTGKSSSPSISQPVLKWEFQTKNKEVGSAVIGSDGTIYLVSGMLHSDTTGFLYAINPDGTEKWCFQLIGPPSYTTPAIAQDGTIYVHCNPKQNIGGSTFLYAINYDGALKWMIDFGFTFAGSGVSSPVIGSDGTIYLGSGNTLFYSINPDGKVIWARTISKSSIRSSPVISSTGSIYIVDPFYLSAFSSNGNLLWSTMIENSSGSSEASPAISNDGTIYIGKNQSLYAYNPNGELKWKYDTGASAGSWPILSTPVIDSDSTIYLVGDNGLYALNSNGKLKWRYQLTGIEDGCASPSVAGDGTIYFRSTWVFYAIDRNGKLKWSIGKQWSEEMKGDRSELQGAPIGSEGTLYVTTVFGSLRAYSAFVAPDIAIDPASKNFGNVLVGNTASQVFTITNAGNADVVVAEGGTTLGGANAVQFTIVSGGAPFTVVPLGSHEVTVSFNPGTTGSKSAILQIASNDPDENPLLVSLTGQGYSVPDIAVNPTSLEYGLNNIGSYSDKSIIISNTGVGNLNVTSTAITGTNAAEFLIQNGGGSFTLTPGAVRNMVVRFSPSSAGDKSASLSISSNDPDENPLLVSLTGQCNSAPDIAVNPTSLEYGPNNIGSHSDKIIIISNTGTGNLNVTSTAITGTNAAEFLIQSGGGSFTLTPGAVRNMVVSFSPSSAGDKNASLSISSNDLDENPLLVNLSGTGILPDIAVNPTALEYGLNNIGTYSDKSIIISNTGTGDLNVTSTAITGTNASEFHIQSGGGSFTLTPAAVRNMVVRFSPLSVGAKTASLSISSNDPDENPLLVNLSGTGILPDIAVNPTSLEYGLNNIGTYSDKSMIISNTGTGNLYVDSTAITGANAAEFLIQSGGGSFTLTPAAVRNMVVRFSPSSVGAKTASLSISSNDPDENPLLVILTGQALPSVGIDDETASLPTEFKLLQNYPNPFNPKTTIEFQLPKTGLATLSVFDLKGMEVRSLISGGIYAAGIHTVVWDAIDNQGQKTATGIYFYRLEISLSEKSAAKFVAVKKMILTK